ncbi:MAG: hypothetical protein K9K37_05660 [Desulfocapsa sp.]|nr:hypothetical protein [Desulfocapsa sp.]
MKYPVTKQFTSMLLALLFVFMTCGTGAGQLVDYSKLSKEELQKKIASFGLGFGSYVVGKALTGDQQAIAAKDNAYKAYPGTVKFKDQDIFVIADQESNVVIAVYKRNKKASKNDFKTTISELMMQYGEPTTEAHGNQIYWNYGADGLIPEELYQTVKSQGQLATLAILATVKFSSSQDVETMTSMIKKMEKKEAGEDAAKEAEEDVTSDNYVMIQSDMLTKKYIQN